MFFHLLFEPAQFAVKPGYFLLIGQVFLFVAKLQVKGVDPVYNIVSFIWVTVYKGNPNGIGIYIKWLYGKVAFQIVQQVFPAIDNKAVTVRLEIITRAVYNKGKVGGFQGIAECSA